jgi:hypothetical protein
MRQTLPVSRPDCLRHLPLGHVVHSRLLFGTRSVAGSFAAPSSTTCKNAGVGSSSQSRERRCIFRCSTDCAGEAAAAFFPLTLSRREQSPLMNVRPSASIERTRVCRAEVDYGARRLPRRRKARERGFRVDFRQRVRVASADTLLLAPYTAPREIHKAVCLLDTVEQSPERRRTRRSIVR